MKTKFCSESERDTVAAELLQPPLAISKCSFHKEHKGFCYCTALAPCYSLHHTQMLSGAPEEQYFTRKNLQNRWKTVLCSHYQGLSTVLWAPSHLSLNKPFPLLIFHVTQNSRYSWTMKCTFWKAPFYCLYPKSLEKNYFPLKEHRSFPCLLWQRHKTYQCFDHTK